MDETSNAKGRAVPLVSYRDKKFIIEKEAEDILRNSEHKTLGIISLVGKYRTGKSFLLNRVLLNSSQKGFGVGPTIKPCTKGIWLWSEPVVLKEPKTGENMSVFIIDTEGLGAYDEEVNHDTKIFLIAVLISSLFIFNSFGVIDETAISSLSFILNLSKTIKVSNNGSNDPNELAKYFPSLLWLLRDFTLRLEDSEGVPITSRQYLENALKIQKGSSEKIDEKNKLRKLIQMFFPDRDCVTLVRPVENEQMLQSLMSIPESDMRKEFVEQASSLRNKVFSKVAPKLFNGKVLSGDMLLELLNSILESINTGGVPVIENSWKYVCDSDCLKRVDNMSANFKVELRQYKDKYSSSPTFFKDFENFSKSLIRQTLEKFSEEAIGNDTFDYEEKLRAKLNSEISKFNEENLKFYEQKLDSLLESNSEELRSKLEANGYAKNYYEFYQDLDNFKENTESAIPEFNLKKVVIYSYVMNLVKKFMDITFVKTKQITERELINLKSEVTNLTNRLKIKTEEYENMKGESSTQIEKLNDMIMEYKINDNIRNERLKNLELEKAGNNSKNENQILAIRKEYEAKISKMKEDMIKLEKEIKEKDGLISSNNSPNDKLTSITQQKMEFLENELNLNYNKIDQMKKEIDNSKKVNEDLQNKIEEMKVEINKKKMLEFELEKIKKDGSRKGNNEDSMNQTNNSFVDNPIFKKQALETKRILDEVITTLKANSENIPKNIADTLDNLLQANKNLNVKLQDNVPVDTMNMLDPDILNNMNTSRTAFVEQKFSEVEGKKGNISKDDFNKDSTIRRKNDISNRNFVRDETSPDIKEPNRDNISLSPIEKRISNNILLTSNNNFNNIGNDRSFNNILITNDDHKTEKANLTSDSFTEGHYSKSPLDKAINLGLDGHNNPPESNVSVSVNRTVIDLNKTNLSRPEMDIEIKAPKFSLGNSSNKVTNQNKHNVPEQSQNVEGQVDNHVIPNTSETNSMTKGKENIPETSNNKGKKIIKKTVHSSVNNNNQLDVSPTEEEVSNKVNPPEILRSRLQKPNKQNTIRNDESNLGEMYEDSNSTKQNYNYKLDDESQIGEKKVDTKKVDGNQFSESSNEKVSLYYLTPSLEEGNSKEMKESQYSYLKGEKPSNKKSSYSKMSGVERLGKNLTNDLLQTNKNSEVYLPDGQMSPGGPSKEFDFSKKSEEPQSRNNVYSPESFRDKDFINNSNLPDSLRSPENRTNYKRNSSLKEKEINSAKSKSANVKREMLYRSSDKFEHQDDENPVSNNKLKKYFTLRKDSSKEGYSPIDNELNNEVNQTVFSELENREKEDENTTRKGKNVQNASEKVVGNKDQSPRSNESMNVNLLNNSQQNFNYQDIINSNKNLANALQYSESRIHRLEEKINSLKEIKSLVNNNTVSIQCKLCKKYFEFELFKKHSEVCGTESTKQNIETKDLKIKILKGLLKKDEVGKPYIEYIIEVEYNHQNWRVSRKFNQFTSLHKYLKTNYPNNTFPESSKLFSKFDTTHENKLALLEKYLKDLNNIQEIKKSKMFVKFFGLDDYADLDFDLELKNHKSSVRIGSENKVAQIEEVKEKIQIPKDNASGSKQKDINTEESKNLKIDLNKINNYNPQEKDSDTGRSKRKNKNLSFS